MYGKGKRCGGVECQRFEIVKFMALGSYEITGLFLSEKHPFWVKLHSSCYETTRQ
jgi:hypothetical protein